MEDVIVVGAGISGLATAYFLRQRGWNPLVLEAGPRVGGNLQSYREEGFLRDTGPNSLLLKGDIVPTWLHELGLETEQVEANAVARRRYIVNQNHQPVAIGPGILLKGSLLSLSARLRLLSEPLRRPRLSSAEESIASFVRRRLGADVLTWLVDPFVSGIFAGNPEQLSVQASLPRLVRLEQQSGSLLRGALRARKGAKTPKSRLISFREGLQTLPLRVSEKLGDAVHCNTPIDHLERQANGVWEVHSHTQRWHSRRVILALPARAAADLLAATDPTLSQLLEEIPYPAVRVLSLGFQRADIRHPLDGFGMLIPRILGLETLGVLFSSTLFPDRAPSDQVLLTVFIGGSQNHIQGRSDAALLETVLRELQPLLGICGNPTFIRHQHWPEAIPQYELGHLERIQHIDALTEKYPGLYFRANWRDGVALGDCMEAAYRLSREEDWSSPQKFNAGNNAPD
ncbi:MAG: protoporphyrinogen oxidase [Acidithiobacillus sp.]